VNALQRRAAANEILEKVNKEELRHETAMAFLAEELAEQTALIYVNDKPMRIEAESQIGGWKTYPPRYVVKVLHVRDL